MELMQTLLLIPFLNRAGEFDSAEWFQLVPKGSFPITRKEKDGVVRTYLQVVDDRSVALIVESFRNRLAENPSFKVLVDFEHFSHDPGKSSEAATWITAMEARADGVWARGEWSDAGTAAIKNRRYRFLSPVWFPHQTERITAESFRPTAVNDAGLTNKPNLGDALQPFWNRADFHGREAAHETTTKKDPMKERLLILLGLAAATSDDQLVTAVEGFKNRAGQTDALQTKLAALEAEHTAFKNRHTSLLNAAVERTLDEHKGIIAEEAKAAWKNRLESDFEGTTALLKGIKPAAAPTKAPVHQSGKAAAAAAQKSATAVEDEEPFMNRVREVAAARKVTEADAIVAVASEEPALYADYASALSPRS